MKTKLLSTTFLGALLLVCNNVEAQSIDYYKSHLNEAQVRAKSCKTADQSSEIVKMDCENAVSALTSKMFDNGIKKAPPYGTTKINGF